MESNGPNPLPWRRTRYQPFHLRTNIKIDDLDMAALLLSAFRAATMGNPTFSSTIAFMTNCPPAELRFRSELRGWERHVLCRSARRAERSCKVLAARGIRSCAGRLNRSWAGLLQGCLSNHWTLVSWLELEVHGGKNPTGPAAYPIKALRKNQLGTSLYLLQRLS